MVVDAVATEIDEEDRSAARSAFRRHWFSAEEELSSLLAKLGFSVIDQDGILASQGWTRYLL